MHWTRLKRIAHYFLYAEVLILIHMYKNIYLWNKYTYQLSIIMRQPTRPILIKWDNFLLTILNTHWEKIFY